MAWNLNYRTNDALVQTFGVNNLNELTSGTRSGTLTVAGTVGQSGAGVSVTVSGTGFPNPETKTAYADGSWARAGATLADGANTYTASAQDSYGRTSQDTVSVNLRASVSYGYDLNGNLTNDTQRVFEYDFENQLTNVYVASAWRSEFRYDAFGRRRVRREYAWSGGAWALTNEVRYLYDGLLVVQERDGNNLPLVSYTRGRDLSGGLQGAGGIGGLLARTDHWLATSGDASAHAYYHADGNGNITCLVNPNGAVVARYAYDPFGHTLAQSGPLATANPYRFSSKEYHPASSLYYFGFRFYDPTLQRWINRDPIGEAGGWNLCEFVCNSPPNLADSDGEKWWWPPSWSFWRRPRPPSPLPPATTNILTDQILWQQLQSNYTRLQNNPGGKQNFDTLFWNTSGQEYRVYNGQCYRGNDVNYIGIGMYEAWSGHSLTTALEVTYSWKAMIYAEEPSDAVIYWLQIGYNAYAGLVMSNSPPPNIGSIINYPVATPTPAR